MNEEMLDVVDENDETIATASRSEIVQAKLGCRIVAVLFYTPSRDIILQRRHISKTYGGQLTATVTGHVKSGDSYDATALREIREETGQVMELDELRKGNKVLVTSQRGLRWIQLYTALYDGQPSDLVIEPGEGDGFVAVSIDDVSTVGNGESDYAPFISSAFGAQLVEAVAAHMEYDEA
jgi:8-oxo-dGTP pyrophosphatase MutT (NUDIX family)